MTNEETIKSIELIQQMSNKIKNMNFATLLSLLNGKQLEDEELYDFIDTTKSYVFSNFSKGYIENLYHKSINKNSNVLRYLGKIRLTFEQFYGRFKKNNYTSKPGNTSRNKRVYELCDLAFYSNKLTKMCALCNNSIFEGMSDEDKKKLETYYCMEKVKKSDLGRLLEETEEFREKYIKYRDIRRTETVNYYIKGACIRTILEILKKDNFTQIKNWGFYKDNKGNDVFAIDFPEEFGGAFQFHIPEKEKILSVEFEKQMDNFEFRYGDVIKKQKKYITWRNKSKKTRNEAKKIIESKICKLSDSEKAIIAISNKLDIMQILNIHKTEQNYSFSDDSYSVVELGIKEDLISLLKATKKLAVQEGNNLDINSSIYAIQRELLNKGIINDIGELEIIRIPAGKHIDGIVNIDNGNLAGIRVNNTVINGNEELGEKSTCSILSKIGFYVPKEIIKNADIVYDERILKSNFGLVLARELHGKKLFEFAEEKRETGEPMLTAMLTEEELKRFDLYELAKKRQEEIEEAKKKIKEHTYIIDKDKKITIVPEFIKYGSYIAYSNGSDFYVSIGEGNSQHGATFAITANPNKGNGCVPNEIFDYGLALRRAHAFNEEESGVFVSQNRDKIICGGLKNNKFKLYPELKSEDAKIIIMNTLKQLFKITVGTEELFKSVPKRQFNDEKTIEEELGEIKGEIENEQ